MKRTLLISLCLFSFNIMACPDLSGTFLCETNTNDAMRLKISKRVENAVPIYTFKENLDEEVLWIVDGSEYSFTRSSMDGISNLKYRASCQKKSLLIKMSGDVVGFDQAIQVATTLNLGSKGELIQTTSGQFSDGTPIPEVRVSCLPLVDAPGNK